MLLKEWEFFLGGRSFSSGKFKAKLRITAEELV